MQKGMDQNLLCHIWSGWTSMYQLFGGSAGVIQFWTHIKFFKNMDISCIKTTVCIYIYMFVFNHGIFITRLWQSHSPCRDHKRFPNSRRKRVACKERLNDKKDALLEKELILEEAGPSIMGMLTLAGIRGLLTRTHFWEWNSFFLKPWSGPKVWQWSKFICSVLFTNTKYIIYPLFSANVAVAGWKISLNKGLYISLGKLSMEIPKLKWRRWGIVNCHVWWHVLGTKYGIPLFHVMLFPEPAVERFDLSWCWLDS